MDVPTGYALAAPDAVMVMPVATHSAVIAMGNILSFLRHYQAALHTNLIAQIFLTNIAQIFI